MADAEVCVYCRKRPAAAPWVPFCSERCRMADLGRWFAGDYRVAGTEIPPDADDPESEPTK